LDQQEMLLIQLMDSTQPMMYSTIGKHILNNQVYGQKTGQVGSMHGHMHTTQDLFPMSPMQHYDSSLLEVQV
jgi:hypothetical protein